ncbi:MAG: aminoglycoside phosphotransferase family protein [Methylobacteriaceae bacterium]|nr:aminoglycoside phosphotransferase family protein [Methylobacteriaceae bacterium]
MMTRGLARLGLLDGNKPIYEPLTGGVSSDIYKVRAGSKIFVVKRALAKLRVAADWCAPTERSAYEVAWLETAGRIVPDAVPAVLGHDEGAGLFAMSYLPPEDYSVWKTELLGGEADAAFAAEVGRRLAAIHAATAGDPDIARQFATDDIFHSIRLEPYLEATAAEHPEVADRLINLSRATLATKRALVHGDVSPKNILHGPKGPVFLDAECAWYGDPAFDLAFCLNHLLLKCLAIPPAAPAILGCFDALADTYLRLVTWEGEAELQRRAAALLPGLFLARIDGKSPVEYIRRETERQLVRETAVPLLLGPVSRLGDVRRAWAMRLGLERTQVQP